MLSPAPQAPRASHPQLLTDPFLQRPTESSVRVVWFTEFPGDRHQVRYGDRFSRVAVATTKKLTQIWEDANSQASGAIAALQKNFPKNTNESSEDRDPKAPIERPIWRHEAEINGLVPGRRVPYFVTSVGADGTEYASKAFSLAAKPDPGKPLKILLTSDHQLKPMVAANLQKVVETVGRVDAVFFAGDLTNIPDRDSEWFDDERGSAFFPCLQGRASVDLGGVTYRGGEILQNAPMFVAIGNHEVMGRFSKTRPLNARFDDALPRDVATVRYAERVEEINSNQDPQVRDAWVKAHSFNTDTYEELFDLPESGPGGKTYYAVTFGDVRLVVLYVTQIWRSPSTGTNVKGRYQEPKYLFDRPQRWGYGQHIFEAIAPGSPQYEWLRRELKSPEFQGAKYKVVMFHHPPHTLGDNIVPPFADPVQRIDRDKKGNVRAIRYEYPQEKDYILNTLVPLLESAGTQLVYFGHSHLWNRFQSAAGTHYLESSNVGNTYGAYLGDRKRPVPPNAPYAETGDPNGLEAIVPTLAPLLGDDGQPLPYISSNEISVFSIFDTGANRVTSYYFDTRKPDSPVIAFDEFSVAPERDVFGF